MLLYGSIARRVGARQRRFLDKKTYRVTFRCLKNENLPALAWIATIGAAGDCTVEHGRLVEARADFLVEGIWNGRFEDGGFDECESFFGSGIVRRSSGEVMAVPSSTTVDYLYYRERPGQLICSNSLPFLLAATADRLDEFNPAYGHANDSILVGIKRYKRDLPTKSGGIRRLMYHNLVWKDGGAREVDKPLPPAFETYEQYRDYFGSTLGGMIKNARDPARKTPLRIISTQSTGYDSTAINAVAHNHGVDVAVSVAEIKARHGYFSTSRADEHSDSGEEIAERLGMPLELIDRRYFMADPENEYLYWAGMHNCQDFNLHQVKEYVGNGAVLLMGVLGEIWYNKNSLGAEWMPAVNDELERGDLSCHGLSEARLHIGFVHAAAPYIGARRRELILKIGDSEDMRPWSIGGRYDRPIARRMAEEEGVPRKLFGQTKRATIVEVIPPYLPHGAALRGEFFEFYRRKRGRLGLLRLKAAPRINFVLMLIFKSYNIFRPYNKVCRIVRSRVRNEFVRRIFRIAELEYLGQELRAVLYAYSVNKAAHLYAASTEAKKADAATLVDS